MRYSASNHKKQKHNKILCIFHGIYCKCVRSIERVKGLPTIFQISVCYWSVRHYWSKFVFKEENVLRLSYTISIANYVSGNMMQLFHTTCWTDSVWCRNCTHGLRFVVLMYRSIFWYRSGQFTVNKLIKHSYRPIGQWEICKRLKIKNLRTYGTG